MMIFHRIVFLISSFIISCWFCQAQKPDSIPAHKSGTGDSMPAKTGKPGQSVTYFKLDDGDSVPVVNLPPVEIFDKLNPLVVDNMKRYLKLKRDVIRAYPYAKLAASTLMQINDSLQHISKKRLRKKYLKESEKNLKVQFEAELKKLSINQGKILLKLINRETGDTSYEIVKELRGTFDVIFWQMMAKLIGSNLKSEYDPKGEDQVIESIVQSIEKGEIPVVKK